MPAMARGRRQRDRGNVACLDSAALPKSLPGDAASDGLLIALPEGMRLTYFALLLALGTGCASQSTASVKTQSAASIEAGSLPRNGTGLRHFYLLSPGPNATLVVTRSDLTDH
jgi:hypothetical protein